MSVNLGFKFDLKNYEKEGGRIFITAMSGGGKSYAAKVFCEELISAGYPLIIIDPEGEYASLREYYTTIIVGGSFADIPLTKTIIDHTLETVYTSQKPIVAIYDLNLLQPSDQQDFAVILQEKLFAVASEHRRPIFFLVEECQLVAPQIARKGQDTQSLDLSITIAKRGRKRGINSVWVTQRPASVNKDVITQCNLWFFGRVIHETDLAQLKPFLKNAKIETTDIMELKNQFYLYDGSQTNLVKFRALKIKDLALTPTLGTSIELTRTTDRSLESILKDLVQQAQVEEQKQKTREDQLSRLEAQVKNYQEQLQEKDDHIKQLEHDLDLVGKLRVVSGGDNQQLQKVLDDRHSLENEKKVLQNRLNDLQQQYKVLANSIEEQNKFLKIKDELQQKLQEIILLLQSIESQAIDVQINEESSQPISTHEFVDKLSFIKHPAIRKEINEVANSPGISAKAVKGIIALLTQKESVTYEEVRKSLGYSDTTAVSKAAKRLADRAILSQKKTSTGGFSVSLNITALQAVIDLQEKRAQGEQAINDLFKEDQ
ncbi:MAG: helicase HerA domain-containing protein [Candidatus Thorarchaeota archaeon]